MLAIGGAFEAVDELKGRLVRSMAERTRRIESGEQIVVGVNSFTETADSPLGGSEQHPHRRPRGRGRDWSPTCSAWRAGARRRLRSTPRSPSCARGRATATNIMAPSIALAKAGGTTGEWAAMLREVFGEFRAPTGVSAAVGRRVGRAGRRSPRS